MTFDLGDWEQPLESLDCALGRSSGPRSALIKGQQGTAPPWPLG
jgi:hypothetical protein